MSLLAVLTVFLMLCIWKGNCRFSLHRATAAGVISWMTVFEANVCSAVADLKTATFSGGDSYIMQGVFNDAKYDPTTNQGIKKVVVGRLDEKQTIQITYDDEKVTYNVLLGKYWRNIKPTQDNGQFSDKGSEYSTVIWVGSDKEKASAIKSKNLLFDNGIYDAPRDKLTGAPIPPGPPLMTEIRDIREIPESLFQPAEIQNIDGDFLRQKADRSGRTKYFQQTYGVKTYSNPKTKVGGYVTFPCSGACIDVIDGKF